jgi:hypothetical protein
LALSAFLYFLVHEVVDVIVALTLEFLELFFALGYGLFNLGVENRVVSKFLLCAKRELSEIAERVVNGLFVFISFNFISRLILSLAFFFGLILDVTKNFLVGLELNSKVVRSV